MKDTVIIIPAFNEEHSIGLVLDAIPRDRVLEVIVVNNNSWDKTAHVAKSHGARVLFEGNRGYGQACLTGIKSAYLYNPKNIVFLDADYSDFPQDMKGLLSEIDQGFDMVIGSRTRGGAEENSLLPQAIFGNWLATSLLRLCFGGYAFTDLGPFRAIKTDALKLLEMKDTNFGWTVEMQAKALIYKLKCQEVSVRYRKRIGVSKITGTIQGTFKAGYKILFTIGNLWIKKSLGVFGGKKNFRKDH